MDRRRFLQVGAGTGSFALGLASAACSSEKGVSIEDGVGIEPTREPSTRSGTTRYGLLAAEPDANDLLLPEGFTSELLAVGGERVPGTSYEWHPFPDGGACFATDDGGWIYANNSEVYVEGAGGASALRVQRGREHRRRVPHPRGNHDELRRRSHAVGDMAVVRGGARRTGVGVRPAGPPGGRGPPRHGVFRHEAVAADEARRVLYLSEDERDGLLYRFRPTRWGDLSEGELAALVVNRDGTTRWELFEGTGAKGTRTRYRVPGRGPSPEARVWRSTTMCSICAPRATD